MRETHNIQTEDTTKTPTKDDDHLSRLTIKEIRLILDLETNRHYQGKLDRDQRHVLLKLNQKDTPLYDELLDYIEDVHLED